MSAATEYERLTGNPPRLADNELVNAERAVIGSVLLVGFDCLNGNPIRGEDFEDPRHVEIFNLMRQMDEAGQRINQLDVHKHIKREGHRGIDLIYLHLCTDTVIQAVSAEYHAQHVMQEAHYRRLRQAATRFTQMVDERLDPDDITSRVTKWLAEAEGTTPTDIVEMGDAVDEAFDRISAPTQQTATPWSRLNAIIGGWRPGRLYLVGARPGAGKTMLAVNAAVHHARTTGTSAAFMSMEMDRVELTQRAISAEASVEFSRFTRNEVPPHPGAGCGKGVLCEECRLARAADAIRGISLPVDETPSQNPSHIKFYARSVARRGPLGLLVVDYIQLMEERGGSEKRQEQVARWSRSMKLMARELNIPVIVLSQLNRESDKRVGNAPKLSDLRESGALEQDADVVLLMAKDEKNAHGVEWVTVDVAKNRQGPRDAFSLVSESSYMRLVER